METFLLRLLLRNTDTALNGLVQTVRIYYVNLLFLLQTLFN